MNLTKCLSKKNQKTRMNSFLKLRDIELTLIRTFKCLFSLLPSGMWLENKISYRNINNGPIFTHLGIVDKNLVYEPTDLGFLILESHPPTDFMSPSLPSSYLFLALPEKRWVLDRKLWTNSGRPASYSSAS